MSTIPSYATAALPLSGTDQFYLEQGSDADRGKRATIQNVIDKVQSSMNSRISSIEGDVSTLQSDVDTLEGVVSGHSSDIAILRTVAQANQEGLFDGLSQDVASLSFAAGTTWALESSVVLLSTGSLDENTRIVRAASASKTTPEYAPRAR